MIRVLTLTFQSLLLIKSLNEAFAQGIVCGLIDNKNKRIINTKEANIAKASLAIDSLLLTI